MQNYPNSLKHASYTSINKYKDVKPQPPFGPGPSAHWGGIRRPVGDRSKPIAGDKFDFWKYKRTRKSG